MTEENGIIKAGLQAGKTGIAQQQAKDILDQPDCGCEHPEAFHELIPVLAKANIPDGYCRVAGCGCKRFNPNRPGPKVETLAERWERQGKKPKVSAIHERMKRVSSRRMK